MKHFKALIGDLMFDLEEEGGWKKRLFIFHKKNRCLVVNVADKQEHVTRLPKRLPSVKDLKKGRYILFRCKGKDFVYGTVEEVWKRIV